MMTCAGIGSSVTVASLCSGVSVVVLFSLDNQHKVHAILFDCTVDGRLCIKPYINIYNYVSYT